jgi:hypothetical protein
MQCRNRLIAVYENVHSIDGGFFRYETLINFRHAFLIGVSVRFSIGDL